MHVHNWMDATKAVRADYRHRALRHHQEAVGFFQSWNVPVNNISIHRIMFQHLEEDFPTKPLPTLEDWFGDATNWPDWTKAEIPAYKLVEERLCKKFGGEPEDYRELALYFTFTGTTRPIKHHSWGIFDAEDFFGVTFNRESDNKAVPTRTVAENIIFQIYNRIPTPNEWLDLVVPSKWMFADAKQLSKEL